MKIFSALLALLVLSLSGISQETNTFEYIGSIAIDGGEKLSYKIVFNEIGSNKIEGYTITDLYGENLTRTSITGEYDSINKVLSFRELSNVFSKLDAADSTFCYVTAQDLNMTSVKNIQHINGDFKGLFPSGEVCATGTIALKQSNVVRKVNSLADSSSVRDESINTLPDSVKVLNNDEIPVLMLNDKLLVDYQGKDLQLEIWDGAFIDNDKISIYMNGELIQEEITLTSTKKIIKLPTVKDDFTLKIVALNNGTTGVNTVNFGVRDETGMKEFNSRMNKGESFGIEFNLKK